MELKVKSKAGKGEYHWDYREFCYLVYVLQEMKSFKESLNIFIDLHTHQEISEIIRRVIIASMLYDGMTYDQIQIASGASTNTIAKIQNKFYRQKSVIKDAFKKAGSYHSFVEKSIDKRDSLTKMLDNTIAKHSLFHQIFKDRQK